MCHEGECPQTYIRDNSAISIQVTTLAKRLVEPALQDDYTTCDISASKQDYVTKMHKWSRETQDTIASLHYTHPC